MHQTTNRRYFFLFSQRTGFDMSCKLSPLEGTMCTKCQILFSEKNKKNISIFRLLKILTRVLSVKRRHITEQRNLLPVKQSWKRMIRFFDLKEATKLTTQTLIWQRAWIYRPVCVCGLLCLLLTSFEQKRETCQTKTQFSLRICAVCSESSLSAWWNLASTDNISLLTFFWIPFV